MLKILAIAISGVSVGFAGMALAHDMREMAGLAPPPATQLAATAPNAITVDNFAFAPAAMTVRAGTTVTWTNRDDELHTVVSADDPKLFKSGPLDTGDSFSVTFAKPGTYKYYCSIHPHMVGTVVVR
ncbi:MAG TPA: cupredoxin family copper-binding protein [Stellaceae bacterium]|jgi:plastocyanin